MQIEKLTLPPAYQAISDRLQKLILSGELRPGDPLPSETEMAEQFGVNRSTVREGIRQLESEGLVRREGRKRLLVCVPRHADLAPRLTRAMVMQEVTFRELWQVANELEPLAAGLTATVAPEGHVARLRENIDRMAEVIEGAESPAPLDLEFHALLAEGTGNRVLLLAREPVALLLYPTFEAVRPQIEQAARRNLEAHRRIVEAVAARDADLATDWMRKHLRDLRRGWLLAGLDMESRIDPALTY